MILPGLIIHGESILFNVFTRTCIASLLYSVQHGTQFSLECIADFINSSTATKSLNDASAGTGTSTTDWVDLVIGEGGVIDWVVPGWRGEYSK